MIKSSTYVHLVSTVQDITTNEVHKDNKNQNQGVNKDSQNQRIFTSTVINSK